MKGIRLLVVIAVLCLAVLSPLAAPAYACGGYGQYPCSNPSPVPYRNANPYPYTYQYQYQNQYRYVYPSQNANPYPYTYQYQNQYRYVYPYPYQNANPYPYAYQYPNQYIAPAPPPPPPNPPVYYYVPGVTTGYGNYARCQQYGLHQSNCFVPNASNSPNLGSIQMEPGIQIWGNCSAGQTMSQNGTTYQCSKTGAGWFPM